MIVFCFIVPPKVEGGPTNLQVVAGQTLNICCKISGRPTPDVIWYKDRKELKDGERILLDSSENAATLLITNAEEQDAGRYNLCLESDIGRDSFAISVSVVGKDAIITHRIYHMAHVVIAKQCLLLLSRQYAHRCLIDVYYLSHLQINQNLLQENLWHQMLAVIA